MENPTSKLRVMVDANILVAGIGWPRFPSAFLQHAYAGDYQLVLTERIMQEAREAVTEVIPERAFALEEFLRTTTIELVATPSDEEIAANMTLVRDKRDIHVALAAISAKVDYLVTQDRDFTDRDETTREVQEKLNILLPAAFLRQFMGWTSEAVEAIRHRKWEDIEDV
jgi:putative PIN family toxin of toxin-antitoxin system